MKTYYIYVCYPIIKRNDDKCHYTLDFNEMESFASIKQAVNFCKNNYANYMIATEKCDKEIYQSVKNNK